MIAENREDGGRLVRLAWIKWAEQQTAPKPSWLIPWEELSESDKEADRVIWDEITAPYRKGEARMSTFYTKNQRVHLRRDPSQFGLIGCGGYGDAYDAESRTQLVFWEHEGADVVTSESVDDLMGVEEYASTQTMERLYDGVQALLDERERH